MIPDEDLYIFTNHGGLTFNTVYTFLHENTNLPAVSCMRLAKFFSEWHMEALKVAMEIEKSLKENQPNEN